MVNTFSEWVWGEKSTGRNFNCKCKFVYFYLNDSSHASADVFLHAPLSVVSFLSRLVSFYLFLAA